MRPLIVWLLSAACFGQVPTAPATTEVIRPADDFATQIFQDPWDMNQRTDIGWYTFGVDLPSSNLQNMMFSNGIFSALSTSADPNFWALDTGSPDAAPFGKNGESFPIDASKYKRLLIRMNLNGPGLSSATPGSLQALWSNNTLYQAGGPSVTPGYFVRLGWWIYSIDLTAPASAGPNWTGLVDSLRIDPVNLAGITMNVDWVRLVADNPALSRNITWTGGGAVDIFLDNDTNWANGYLAQIATGETGAPPGSFRFYVGGLPVGTYHVAIRATGSAATPAYAPGSYEVEDIPTISFTAPSPTGSSDDFATVQLGNPWDMDTLADVDNFVDVTGPTITNIPAENEAGASLGNVRVLQGTSVQASGAIGDPRLYMLQWTHRGATKRIDSSRYRILDLEMGVTGARDLFRGSIARIVWRVAGQAAENVSEDIILNHLAGANVIQKIVLDMTTLPLDVGPSSSGWTGLIDGFRVDPHEFPEPRTFYVKSVYLRAFERADASYTIRWNYGTAGTSGSPSITLYYDSDNTGFNGTPIATVTDPTTGAYAWNTAALPAGTYYIYSVVSAAGTVLNRTYARWPVVIEHGSATPITLVATPSSLTFNVAGGTPPTQDVEITSSTGAPVLIAITSTSPGISHTIVSAPNGQGFTPQTIRVSVNPSLIGAGTITSLNVTTNNPAISGITIPINITGGAGSTFGVNPTFFNFSQTGATPPPAQAAFVLSNTVTPSYIPTLTYLSGGSNWLTVSPALGQVSTSSTVTVTPTSAALVTGVYQATLTLTPQNILAPAVQIPITLSVNQSSTQLTTSPASLLFTFPAGTSTAQTLPLSVWSGSASVAFTPTLSSNLIGIVQVTGNTTTPTQLNVSVPFPQFVPVGTTGTLTLTPAAGSGFGITTVPIQVNNATLSVDRSQLRFGATTGGTSITGPQEVQVNLTGGTGTWIATANQPWISVSPTSGTGSGKFTVSLNQGSLPAGAANGSVTVTVPGAINSPQTVAVSLNVVNPAATAAPFGVVDTPTNGATNLHGAIGVTGWALDDIEVVRISVWRDRIGNEPVHPNGLVYIIDGVFLEGARPDVANAFPTYPLNTRAGWGVQILTNMLINSDGSPGTGNGTYKFSVFAHDREGKTTLLGARTVTVNNATSTQPFGTLDTPGNGETISGNQYTVFGWALTPQPGTIPTNGSTIAVFVDGVSLGSPVYDNYRADIAMLFPGYNNTGMPPPIDTGAVGYFYLDTTTLSNGLHSIAWSVTDNLGRTTGIGSRLFWVRN